jgi:hypothetical protein
MITGGNERPHVGRRILISILNTIKPTDTHLEIFNIRVKMNSENETFGTNPQSPSLVEPPGTELSEPRPSLKLFHPRPSTELTRLCIICHLNIMRCICYVTEIIDDNLTDAREAQQEIEAVHRNLQESYFCLRLWINDSNVLKGPAYLHLGGALEEQIRVALSTLHGQLLLLTEAIDRLGHPQDSPYLNLDDRIFPVQLASNSIMRAIYTLADMQSVVHHAQQASGFLRMGTGGDIEHQIERVFQDFTSRFPDLPGREYQMSGDTVDVSLEETLHKKVGWEKCTYCGESFPFSALECHQELNHGTKDPKRLVPASAPLVEIPASMPGEIGEPALHPQPKEKESPTILQQLQESWTDNSPSTPRPALGPLREAGNASKKSSFTWPSLFRFDGISTQSEFRLLKVLRGKTDEPIRCILFTVPLGHPSEYLRLEPMSKSIEYIAISYCWDQAFPSHELKIFSMQRRRNLFGHQSFKNFKRGSLPIRSSVDAILRQVRSEKDDVNVWIDEICINRESGQGISDQIGNIPSIFNRAKKVLICLGPATPKTKETFEFLSEITNLENFDDLVSMQTWEKWELVLELLANRWFCRRWPVQEFAFARDADICWGGETMPWQTFIDALALFIRQKEYIEYAPSKLATFSDQKDPLGEALTWRAQCLIHATNSLFRKSINGEVQQKMMSLEYLVTCLLIPFKTTDPRDSIYAALSMAKDTPRVPEISELRKPSILLDYRIAPNYALEAVDVYVAFVEYCIESSKRMDILCRHWAPVGGSGLDDSPPSWIQSVKEHAFGGRLGGRLNADGLVDSTYSVGGLVYNASAGFTDVGCITREETLSYQHTSIEMSKKPISQDTPLLRRSRSPYYTLTTKSYYIGRIWNVSRRMLLGLIPRGALEVGGWAQGSSAEDAPNDLWRIMVANRGPNGSIAPAWYRRAFVETLRYVDKNGDLDTNRVKHLEQTPKTIISFLNRLQQVVLNRCVFQADIFGSGLIGRGFGSSMIGLGDGNIGYHDEVHILPGCSVPVVLRHEGSFYSLVAECYLHGVMEGEAADALQTAQPDKIRII